MSDASRACAQQTLAVRQVSGEYCKIPLPAEQRVAVGDRVRFAADGEEVIFGTVTAVAADYFVARFASRQLKVGDAVAIRGRTSSKSAEGVVETTENPEQPARKTRQELLAEKQAELEASRQARWEAALAKTGVKPWAVPTEAQHAETTAKHRELMKQVGQTYQGMQLYETEQFLFFSNIPANQVGPYVLQLDKMYELLMKMYQIPADQPVWLGKCLVVAFVSQQQFAHFEQTFMNSAPAAKTYGRCHQNSNGSVVVGCYRGENPHDFGHMLVHETSHGFLHRYRTSQRLPAWVNEGLADYVGQVVVPTSRQVALQQRARLQVVARTRSLEGALNEVTMAQSPDYGIYSWAVTFLIKLDDAKFKEFIDLLKAGVSYPESLQQSYGATPEQFISSLGATIGIPNLRP
ncbi:MAG: hypothetical protein KDB14_35005 [Planctomycetales bacterium]|nr:hypothetical protein [Planctomycetales bacterium]